jgi:hypothetical protein
LDEEKAPEQNKLEYFMALNKSGRKKAGDPRTTKEEFVELLCQVIESDINDFAIRIHLRLYTIFSMACSK